MPKKKPSGAAAGPDESFEASLAELDAIVGELESGELGLAEALSRYEEGVRRLKSCHKQLESAERRIELLSGVDAEGNPVTTPFDDRATADEEGPSARSQKRTAATKPSAGGRGAVDDRSRLF